MYEGHALQKAIYTALDGTLTGGVYDYVPPDAPYPYTVIGDGTEAPDDLHDNDGAEETITLHVWSRERGAKQVKTILKEIDAALHFGSLSPTGASVWTVEREFTEIMRDRDPDTGEELRHGVARYRIGMEAT